MESSSDNDDDDYVCGTYMCFKPIYKGYLCYACYYEIKK